MPVRRGLGVVGAFVIGVLAAVIVLAGALISLPFWPEEVRAMWRGHGRRQPAPTPAIDLQAVRADATAVATAAVEAARRELTARLDDLDKRLRAAVGDGGRAAGVRPRRSHDPAIAELRSRVESAASSGRPPAAAPAPARPQRRTGNAEAEKEIAVADARDRGPARRALDRRSTRPSPRQRDQAKSAERPRWRAPGERGGGEQKALGAARASAVIGVAARLSAALDAGLPFAADLGLLTPLVQGDAKLGEIIAALQPYAQTGVASRTALAAAFPAVAKAALADDLADDSFGERLLGKLKGLVSLRRVGADVPGDSVEAKLARAEAGAAMPATSPRRSSW